MPAQKVAQALNRPTKGIKGTVPHPASSPRRRRVDRLGRKKAIPVAKAIFTSSDRKMVESTPGTSPLPDPQKVVEDLDFSLEDPQTTAKPISSPLRAVSAKKNFAAKKRKAQPNPDSSYRDEEDDHVKLLIRRRAAVERGIGRSSRNKSSPQTLPVAPIIDDQPLENTEANILDPSHHLSTRVIDFAKIAQEKIQQADFLKVLSQQREEAKRQMIAEFDDNDITLVDHDECTDQSERDEPEDLTTTLLSRLLTSAASHTTDAQITPQAPVAPIEAFERREDTSVRQRRRLSIDVGGNLAQPSKLAPGIGLTRPRVVNVVRDVFGPKDRREVLSKPPPVFRVPQPRTGRVPFEPLTNSESNVPIRKKQVPLIRAKQPELAPQKISSHVSPPVIHVPSTPQYPVRAVSGSRETVRRAGDEPQPHRRLQSIQRPSPARERSRGGLPTFEPASLIGRFDEALMGMTAELDREGEEALDESHNALREVLEMLVDRDALRIAHLEAQKERVFSPLQDELLTINQWDKDGRMRQSEELLGDRMTTLEQEILKFNGALDALWAQHGAMTQEIGTLRSLAVPNNSVPKPKVPSRPTEEQQEKIWMSGSLEEKEALLVMLTSARQDLAQEKEQEAEPDIWQEYHEQLGILMESTKRKLAELDKTDERDQKEQRKKLLSLLENL